MRRSGKRSLRHGKPSLAASRQTTFQYQTLEPRRLLANLSIADAFVSGIHSATRGPVPIEGQLVAVTALYVVDDFDSNIFHGIEYKHNGVVTEKRLSGVRNGSYFEQEVVTFATPGVNTIEIRLDVQGQVDEDDETDNYFSFEFTALDPQLSAKFVWPFGGVERQDEYLPFMYPDLDRGPNISDHMGFGNNSDSYNLSGSNARVIAYGPLRNRHIDNSLPVFASASGTVAEVNEYVVDRYSPGIVTNGTNFLTIEHDGGFGIESEYYNFRRDSIEVQEGDRVEAGQLLGYIGGYASSRHAAFQVIYKAQDRLMNPFATSATYWDDGAIPEYPHDNPKVADSVISTIDWRSTHEEEGPTDFRTFFNGLEDRRMNLTTRIIGIQKGDAAHFVWRQPNGEVFIETSTLGNQSTRLHDDFSSQVTMPEDAELGEWEIEIWLNDIMLAEETFEVTEQLYPAISVTESNELHGRENLEERIVTDGRYSPYNLESVALNSDSPAFKYRVQNLGTGNLEISQIEIPEGFIAVDYPDVLLPLQWFVVTLRLDTTQPGYRVGQVRIHSNDPGAVFNFSVEGNVEYESSALESGYFTVGVIEREVLEGETLLANVKIPREVEEDLVFDLTYDNARVSGPAQVTIPAGRTRVSFDIMTIEDPASERSPIVKVQASLPNNGSPNVATHELLLLDSPLGLSGTEGDDDIKLTIGEEAILLEINSVTSDISGGLDWYFFDALGGNDTITIVDSSGDETTTFEAGSVVVRGDYTFMAVNVESSSVTSGGGTDTALMYRTDEADLTFISEGGTESLSDDRYDFAATGYSKTYVNISEAGISNADFFDSPQDDTFYATPGFAYFGHQNKAITVRGFDQTSAYATSGGDDLALMLGSEGDDQYYSNPEFSNLRGEGFEMNATGFETSITRALGGLDNGVVQGGSEETENFYGTPVYATRRTTNQFVRIDNVEQLSLISGGGDGDRAIIRDSEGDDLFSAAPGLATMFYPSHRIAVMGFPHVVGTSGQGADNAILDGSESDDKYVGRPNAAWMFGDGFFNHSIGFGHVSARGLGGNDSAVMFGSELDDYFDASSQFARLSADSYFLSTQGFQKVSVQLAQGGNDFANLIDSEDDDTLVGSGEDATLFNDDYSISISFSETVRAVSENGGLDQVFEDSIQFELLEIGNWQ